MPGVLERERKGVVIWSGGEKARERRFIFGRRGSIVGGNVGVGRAVERWGGWIGCVGSMTSVTASSSSPFPLEEDDDDGDSPSSS